MGRVRLGRGAGAATTWGFFPLAAQAASRRGSNRSDNRAMQSPIPLKRGAEGPSATEVLDGLAAAAAAPLEGATVDEVLAAVARAAGLGAGATLAVVRVAEGEALAARAMWAPSTV